MAGKPKPPDPAANRLTARQRQALEAIQDSHSVRGFGPTIREIADAMGIASSNGVVVHLRALEKKGFIRRSAHLSRSIRMVEPDDSDRAGIPMAGLVSAGQPAEANEQQERLDLRQLFASGQQTWALRVSGDSMIEAQIADGDFVIVRKSGNPRSGQIAVVRTDEGEATLKYWFPEKKRIRLQPANSSMKAVYVRSAEVLGVVIGVVRRLD